MPISKKGSLYFTDTQYQQARACGALEYAQSRNYDLVREGNVYHLRQHDSMIFTPDGRWFWNSKKLAGRALEFIMHYEGGSLPDWDNSNKVRQEFIPNERFEIIAEKVRAAFGYELFQDKILIKQTEKRELISQARLELQSLCREANMAEALNLNHVSNDRLDELQRAFVSLAANLPGRGALKYAYLLPDYKARMDSFLNEIMKITDFQRLEKKYINLTNEISQLYGNGAEKTVYNLEKARQDLYKGMGNTVLGSLKDYRLEIEQGAGGKADVIWTLMRNHMNHCLPNNPKYQELLLLLPKERTPVKELLALTEVYEKLSELEKELRGDMRVRALVRGHINTAIKEQALEKEEQAALSKEVYRDLHRVVRGVILEQLQEDAGYHAQISRDAVFSLLVNLFRSGSQQAGQTRSKRDLLRLRSRELSETAKKDRRKQQSQAGEWSQEF